LSHFKGFPPHNDCRKTASLLPRHAQPFQQQWPNDQSVALRALLLEESGPLPTIYLQDLLALHDILVSRLNLKLFEHV